MLKRLMALNVDNKIVYKGIYVNSLKIKKKRWLQWDTHQLFAKQSVLVYLFRLPPHLLHLGGWEAERQQHNEAVEMCSWTEGLQISRLLIPLLLPLAHHHLKLRPHSEMPGFNMLVKRRNNWARVDERNERVWTRQPRQGAAER